MRVAREVNRALHEARRSLQLLLLRPGPPREVAAIAHALDQLDYAVNGTAWEQQIEGAATDRLRLVAAVENLILNALEHGEGQVEITIATSDAGASLTVRNRVRVSEGAGDPRRGHGHGIVERMARQVGGRFDFRADGRQAVATLALPAGETAATGP